MLSHDARESRQRQIDPDYAEAVTFRETPVTFLIGLNLYIAAIYTNIAITAGGFLIPGVLGVAGAIFMFRRNIRNLTWLWALIVFLILSLALGGSGQEMFDYRLPSWLQIVVALGCAHVLLCAFNYPEAVRRTLLLWMVFITVGVILETVLPQVRDLSDAFRETVFEGRFIYNSDARDLREYGFVRPKLFSQEPSHISKAFVIAGAGWYVLASHRRRLAVLLVCTVVVTVFLRSPFTLLALPLAWFLAHMAAGRSLPRVVALGVPALGALTVAATQVFSVRLDSIASGQDFSFFARYQGPYEVATKSLEQHPLFGVGIGAKEALRDEMRVAYSEFLRSVGDFNDVYLDYFNNAFANSLMFFGVVGAAIFYFLIAKWAGGFGVRALVALPVVVLFFLLDGALEGVRMWSSIALVWGCYLLAKRHSDLCVAEGGSSRVQSRQRLRVGITGS